MSTSAGEENPVPEADPEQVQQYKSELLEQAREFGEALIGWGPEERHLRNLGLSAAGLEWRPSDPEEKQALKDLLEAVIDAVEAGTVGAPYLARILEPLLGLSRRYLSELPQEQENYPALLELLGTLLREEQQAGSGTQPPPP